MAQGIAARVCSVCLAPGPLLTLAYARQMALRVVGPVGGGTCKSACFIAGALCFVSMSVVKLSPPTQLGVAYALLKGGHKETSPGFPCLIKKRKYDKGRLYHR